MALRSLAQKIKLLYSDDQGVSNPQWVVHVGMMVFGLIALAVLKLRGDL